MVNVSVTSVFPSGGYLDLQASAVRGIDNLLMNYRIFAELLEGRILPEEMTDALTPTLELARVYCPVDTGELRASGYVESVRTRGRVSTEIGFGRGGHPSYAVMVHENPAAFHKPPTQYKFLERAVFEEQNEVMDRIFKSVKQRAGL